MKKTIKITNLLLLTLLLITYSCDKDDDPVIINLQNLEVTIDENPIVGQVIGTVQSDSASSLMYSITTESPTGAISIDANSGELTVVDASLFDFEINPTITATVSAVEAQNTATVTINLNDLNEISVQDLNVTIDENPTVGQVIGTVLTSGIGSVDFSITSETPAGAMSIDASTGELTVLDAALFDFETNPVITAVISSVDALNTGTVTINLNDLNEISVQDLNITIDENPTVGQVLGTVQTTGTGSISFSITSETPAGAMSIDVNTGELTVLDAALFDFEANPTITAVISSVDALNTGTVTVNLNDIDLLAPLLSTSQANYNAASTGDWIIVTETEYNNIVNNLNGVLRAGTTEAEYNSTLQAGWGSQNTTRSNKTATSIIPNNGYVVAFKYKVNEAINSSGVKIKQSSTANDSGFSDLGNPLPTHSGSSENIYFVLKGSNNSVTADGYLGLFQSDSKVELFPQSDGSYWQTGDTSSMNNLYTGNPYKLRYQGLCTTQLQW